MFLEDLWRIPMSQDLATTLNRAIEYAKNMQHGELTLEHLLVSLIEDPDAREMLQNCHLDLNTLTAEVMQYTAHLPKSEDSSTVTDLDVSKNLKRVLGSAAAAARQGGRKEINGAIVLAAIVGDGKSVAAEGLRAKGFTFEEAIRAIREALQQSPPPSAPSFDRQVEPLLPPLSTEPTLSFPAEHTVQDPSPYAQLEGTTPLSKEEHALLAAGNVPAVALSDVPSFVSGVSLPFVPASPSSFKRPEISVASSPETSRTRPFSPRPPVAGGAQTKAQRGTAALFTKAVGAGPPFSSSERRSLESAHGIPSTAAPRSDVSAHGRALHSSQPAPLSPPQPARLPTEPKRGRFSGSKRGGRSGSVSPVAPHLDENIPRRMRVLRSVLVEAKIPRANVQALSDALEDGGAVYRPETAITKAISLRLRAPQGGFWIENASPETQWIDNILGVVSDEFIRWRWLVTPKARGKRPLQFLISARTLGLDGVAAETALPDHTVRVKVRRDFVKLFGRVLIWLLVLGLFGLGVQQWPRLYDTLSQVFTLLQTQIPWLQQILSYLFNAVSW